MMQFLIRQFKVARTRLTWAWRMGSLGARSVLGRSRLVGNPCSISIGHHTTIADDWSLVDLTPATGKGTPKIRIGNYCSIMHDFQCNSSVSVEIQDYVLIAPRVFITDSNHVVDPEGERTTLCQEYRSAPIVIEHDCWLGVNCVILKGVTIGHHSIIAANAVVTKSVPPHSTIVGIPGKPVLQSKPRTS